MSNNIRTPHAGDGAGAGVRITHWREDAVDMLLRTMENVKADLGDTPNAQILYKKLEAEIERLNCAAHEAKTQ